MDEQQRKKISILGSIGVHIIVFLFISLTGLLKFTTLPLSDDIVEITSINNGASASGISTTNANYQENIQSQPVDNAPISPDSILQHSDTASNDITYKQLQQLQNAKQSSIVNTTKNNTSTNSNNGANTNASKLGNNNGIGNNGISDNNGVTNDSGTNISGNNIGTANDDNIYNSPAIAPRIIKSKTPNYPTNERQQKIQGTTTIRFLIGKDGIPESVDIISSSGNTALDQSALKAAKSWRFTPAKKSDGQPVRCYATQEFTFKIN